MEPNERIIVALDVSSEAEAEYFVATLAPWVGYFKVGLELITAIGGPNAVRLVQEGGGNVFYDGKFKDIPNTVAGAAREVTKLNVEMFNIHCFGGGEMMRAARKAVDEVRGYPAKPYVPFILGVTVLTSLDYDNLVEMGILKDDGFFKIFERDPLTQPGEVAERKRDIVKKLVSSLATLAQNCGLDGVIASPHEVEVIRKHCSSGFRVVTPGVRPTWAQAGDQKRVMTPGDAIRAGADYLVIGRPILKPPTEIGTPVEAAKQIADEIASAL